MIITPAIERDIFDRITSHPSKALILPDFCYWKGRSQPVIYVNRLPVHLSRYLWEKIHGEPLSWSEHLVQRVGVDPRNVNPLLFERVAQNKRGTHCRNGHAYEGNELPENLDGRRCRTCYLAWLDRHTEGLLNPAQINRAKTHCPAGHKYAGGNVIIRKGGRRRCRTCHNDQERIRAAKKRKGQTP